MSTRPDMHDPAPRLRVLTWQEDDGALLEAIRRGERGAEARLYDRFAPRVNAMVWKLLRDELEHDDLVNEVFLRIIGRIHTVRDPASLPSWVSAVVTNTVYKELRRWQIRRHFVRSPPVLPDAAGPAVDFEGRQLLQITYALLARLGAKDRLVFSLRYLDQRTNSEISTLTGFSSSTVKRRLHRARQRFVKLAQSEPLLAERIAAGAFGKEEAE